MADEHSNQGDVSSGVHASPRYMLRAVNRVLYQPVMGHVEFIAEELYTEKGVEVGSMRSDEIDEALTLLWHPYETKLLGFRLSGFSNIADKIAESSDGVGDGMFSEAVEVAGRMLAPLDRDRQRLYEIASGMVMGIAIPPDVWAKALVAA